MNFTKRIISLVLVIGMLLSATIVVSAKEPEEYLDDLRIVYADSYDEAKKILQNTEFKDYKLLDYNLNKSATKVDLGFLTIGDSNGVYLAYKTTTNVDDAITDIAIMQMDGGYREGNYQEMVAKSRKSYQEVGSTYLTAINYMIEAYYAGDFLANCAYRQLEFYYDDDSKMTLGAFFEAQPGADALATMFLEGNSYAVKNVRALIGMGVSYNDDGMTYLGKVSEAAAEMDEDATIFEDEGFEELAKMIGSSMITFRDMLEEVAAYEDELNYEDDEYTDLEIQYAEHTALAEMLRKVTYLGGKTLYDFCLAYTYDEADFSSLYPLVAALNEGQKAITTAGNYYDAVRYSMAAFPEEFMNEEIEKLEETYAENSFSIYTGVDRSIYKDTFALTTDAYRADVSSDKGFLDSVYALSDWQRWGLEAGMGAVGAGLFIWAILRTKDAISVNAAAKASEAAFHAAATARINLEKSLFEYCASPLIIEGNGANYTNTVENFIDEVVKLYVDPYMPIDTSAFDFTTQNLFVAKVNYCNGFVGNMDPVVREKLDEIAHYTQKLIDKNYPADIGYDYGQPLPQKLAYTSAGSTVFTVALYAAGAAMMIYSAYSYGSEVYNYYNPELKDIPTAMVDYVVTDEGDRYIKYDAVTMVEMNAEKEYDPADLNAFGGQRWNALYYTKSYEAGKPLLAKFKVVNNNNVADEKYLPIHRFGEEICYDLNKHNFDYKDSIYVSVAQSDNQKSSIIDVPKVVGSMLGNASYFIAAALGAIAGSFITIGATNLSKKKKETEEK